MCNVFRIDCVIRRDYLAVNYSNYAIFSLHYLKLVLLGFWKRKPLLCCSNEDFFIKEPKISNYEWIGIKIQLWHNCIPNLGIMCQIGSKLVNLLFLLHCLLFTSLKLFYCRCPHSIDIKWPYSLTILVLVLNNYLQTEKWPVNVLLLLLLLL